MFLVAARLQRLLRAAAFGDVETDAGDPRQPPFCIAFGSTEPMHPADGAVRAHDPERLVPVVVVRTTGNAAQVVEDPLTVVLVQRGGPCVQASRTSRDQAVMCMNPLIPIEAIGLGIPVPDARRRGVERELQPMLPLPQRRLGAGAFDRVPRALRDIAYERDLGGRPVAWGRVIGAEGCQEPPV